MIFEVYNEFQNRLSSVGPMVIAGGAVRDHLMGRAPKDYDLFVLKQIGGQESKKLIAATVADLPKLAPALDAHTYEPFLAASVAWQGCEIQIMSHPAPTMKDLIDTFDWSVSLFGFDGEFTARESVEKIKPGCDLWLQKVTYPAGTLRRGFRFSERFKMNIKQDDLVSLCKRVAVVTT